MQGIQVLPSWYDRYVDNVHVIIDMICIHACNYHALVSTFKESSSKTRKNGEATQHQATINVASLTATSCLMPTNRMCHVGVHKCLSSQHSSASHKCLDMHLCLACMVARHAHLLHTMLCALI
jgi:hypothetical protein